MFSKQAWDSMSAANKKWILESRGQAKQSYGKQYSDPDTRSQNNMNTGSDDDGKPSKKKVTFANDQKKPQSIFRRQSMLRTHQVDDVDSGEEVEDTTTTVRNFQPPQEDWLLTYEFPRPRNPNAENSRTYNRDASPASNNGWPLSTYMAYCMGMEPDSEQVPWEPPRWRLQEGHQAPDWRVPTFMGEPKIWILRCERWGRRADASFQVTFMIWDHVLKAKQIVTYDHEQMATELPSTIQLLHPQMVW